MIACPISSPVRFTQAFGERPEVYAQFGMKGHNGIDLTGGKKGELVPIHAPVAGRVVASGKDGGYGNCVRIHGYPDASGQVLEVVLGHMSRLDVRQGDVVRQGDQVGIMGATGFASGPHLHWGLRRLAPNGTVLNYGNGFLGYFDFEPWIQYVNLGAPPNARKEVPGVISYPYHSS